MLSCDEPRRIRRVSLDFFLPARHNKGKKKTVDKCRVLFELQAADKEGGVMDHAYCYLLFAFSALLFLYAGLIYVTKDIRLVARNNAAKMKDPKKYAVQFSKVLAIVAIAPLLSGIVGLFSTGIRAAIVFVGALIGCIGFAVAKIDLDV